MARKSLYVNTLTFYLGNSLRPDKFNDYVKENSLIDRKVLSAARISLWRRSQNLLSYLDRAS